MGVYIKGMEMPSQGEFKHIRIYDNGDVTVEVEGGEAAVAHAVPVQSHGRLVDADALMLEIQEYIEEYGWETDEHGWHNEKWCAMKEAAMVIDAAPTIIPAEEGE